MDELKRDFSVLYVCDNCNTSTPPPTHCGKAMKLEEINGINNWICWKGEHPPCCGRESMYNFENCCSSPSLNPQLQQLLT